MWRIDFEKGAFCLRRWPREHPSLERLRYIHDVLCRVRRAGFSKVPQLTPTSGGSTILHWDGYLWELSTWMDGAPTYHASPSRMKLESAMRQLARFHLAADRNELPETDVPAGLMSRLMFLKELDGGLASRLTSALPQCGWPELQQRGARILEHYRDKAPSVFKAITEASRFRVPLQPCLRDVWHDHVFFVGEEISAIIDFGAMNKDSVSTDLARLLGSLVGTDEEARSFAISAYQTIRPLSGAEQQLITVYDSTTTLLSGINWLRWICLDGRDFEGSPRVIERIDEWLGRLDAAGWTR